MSSIIKAVLLFIGVCVISIICSSQIDYGIPVLMYHHVIPGEKNIKFRDNAAVLDLEDFEKQMQYLYNCGFYTLTAKEIKEILYDSKKINRKCIWLTFDDGYYSNLIYVYPVLKKYNFKATIFAVTSYITDEIIPLNADELVYLNWTEMQNYSDVFDFASHTDNMHEIDATNGLSKLQNSTEDEITDDIKRSISYDKINIKYAFSYPYGKYNDKIINVLKNLGIKTAVTVDKGYLKEYTNPYEIPRFNIYRGISMNRFKLIVK